MNVASPALINFPHDDNGCIVARLWRFELVICLYLYASLPRVPGESGFWRRPPSDIIGAAEVDPKERRRSLQAATAGLADDARASPLMPSE
jgi:hypothetical protein